MKILLSFHDAHYLTPRQLYRKCSERSSLNMFETVKKFFKIIFVVKKSRKINLLLIILLFMNGAHKVKSGFQAETGQFRYVVSIRLSDVHLCTGTIIDETHILTIAHVFIGKYKTQLSVVAGVIMIMHPFAPTFPVEGIYLHPGLEKIDTSGVEDYWENNIAIIKLAKGFQWSTYYGPVQFIKEEIHWMLCPNCMMIYWENPQQEHEDLVAQTWDYVYGRSDERCHERNIKVLRNQECFSNFMNTLLITSKDLGSPIICNNLMIGFVAKKADNQVEGTPSTFLKTLTYLDFIDDVLAEGLVDVGPTEFPYIVSIWHHNEYICGGSILDATHILTAAHCVWGFEQAHLKVVDGYIEVSRQNVAVNGLSVHDIIFHESYKLRFLNDRNYWYTEHDIAVVVLAEPVMFSLTFHTLDYENIREFSPGLPCNSFHWRHGRDRSGMKTMKLKKARMKISTNELCESLLETQEMALTSFQFCARNPYYIKTADYRDCGNPIISEGKPVGILVRAFPLDDKSPSIAIFLWLHPYKDFIRSAMSES